MSESLSQEQSAALRALPSVNELLEDDALRAMLGEVSVAYSKSLLVEIIRDVLGEEREKILNGQGSNSAAGRRSTILQQLQNRTTPPLRPVINGTGIIIHTGLGRAPLAPSAVDAISQVAANYAPVELNLETGQRGQRIDVVHDLLTEITGAESATVVNNNAAALMLTLAALARHQNVIVSRGELIEIGGSFRLPDIMQSAGCTLREVGTTNKTRLSDYERAIDDRTSMLLIVHPSNYRLQGFTASPTVEELAELAREKDIFCVHDVGSGVLQPWAMEVMHDEPDVQRSLDAGCNLVLFSGDKVLGGPQAGIILGRKAAVDRLNKHPMMRAMRLDKMILAGLAVTLQLHRDQALAANEVPVLQMAHATVDQLRGRAQHILASVDKDCDGSKVNLQIVETESCLGGGSVPGQTLPSIALAISLGDTSDHEIAKQLRITHPSIVPRISNGKVLIDLRTVLPSQDEVVANRLASL